MRRVNDSFQPYIEFYFTDDQTHRRSRRRPCSGIPIRTIPPGRQLQHQLQQPAAECPAAEHPVHAGADCRGTAVPTRDHPPTAAVRVAELANIRSGGATSRAAGASRSSSTATTALVAGSKGDFVDAWNYDVYGQYYYTTLLQLEPEVPELRRHRPGAAGAPARRPTRCASAAATCVPYNIWSDGGVTPGAAELPVPHRHRSGSLDPAHAARRGHRPARQVRGQLPTAQDGVARQPRFRASQRARVLHSPTPPSRAGSCPASAAPRCRSTTVYRSSEAVRRSACAAGAGQAFAKDLVFDTGYRHSDYSTPGVRPTPTSSSCSRRRSTTSASAAPTSGDPRPDAHRAVQPAAGGRIQFGNDPCAP